MADPLMRELQQLSDGLVYSSEGDHPFEVVRFADQQPAAPLSEERLRTIVGAPPPVRARAITVERALARHTTLVDPLDTRAQALRPRYAALQEFLEHRLTGAVAFRAGSSPVIDVWMLGRTEGGELLGVHTIAIET